MVVELRGIPAFSQNELIFSHVGEFVKAGMSARAAQGSDFFHNAGSDFQRRL